MSVAQFRKIINNPEICGDKRIFEINEEDKSSKSKNVRIKGFQDQYAVMCCIDGKKSLSPYLAQTGDHLKACDAVVACTHDSKDYLIFIEMKSENVNLDRIARQFKSSRCFMDYCDSILKQFYKSKYLQKCQKRFVVFYKQRPPSKVPTRNRLKETVDEVGNSPDKPKLIEYSKPVWVGKIL